MADSDAQQSAGTAAAKEAESSAGGTDGTLTSELRSVVREAAIEVLSPVARKATTAAAKYAVTRGPKLVKDSVVPRVDQAGGPLELAKKAGGGVGGLVSSSGVGGLVSKLGGDRGGAPSGTGRGRRLPIQESIDVAVPLETAYNQFTQFEEFPEFMHRAERVEQKDDTHLVWHENIWGVRRQWESEITEQRPNERVAWEATSGSPQQKGVVTFHSLSDRLTRVEITLDQQPKGLFEKASSGLRMTRRALKSDLMRFKAFIETREEETGAWRGEVEEGEVVEGDERPEREGGETRRAQRRRRVEREPEPEETEEEPETEEEEPEAEAEEPEEEEPEAEAEEPEVEEEEEPRRKPERRRRAPRRRQAPRRRSPAAGRRR
jgi:uncharacterized membrane protein